MTISTERVRQYATDEFMFAADDVRAMAKELLAVREAQSDDINLLDMKPQEWFEALGKSPLMCAGLGVDVVQRMAAKIAILMQSQTAPAVPAAIEPTLEAIKAILPTANPDEYACCVGADMWNACRAAMLHSGNSGIPAIPDGYKLMPLEMTDEIGEAIAMEANCCGGIALDIYNAALAATPTPTK